MDIDIDMEARAEQTHAALQRKRARDRNAQRSARERRELYIRQLEQQVAFCHAHHGSGQQQEKEKEQEKEQKQQQQQEQEQEHDASGDTHTHTQSETQRPPLPLPLPLPGVGVFRVNLAPSTTTPTPTTTTTTDNAAARPACQPPELPVPQPMALQWSVMPLSDPTDKLGQLWSPWLSCPDVLSLLPETPRPRHLLLGTSKNPVANAIHIALSRFGSLRDIELVAVGWLIYLYTKWLTAPSSQRYRRVPRFLHLTPLQIHCKHAAAIDGIIWPQIRDNMIRYMLEDEIEDVFTLFTACVKLRWPAGNDILVKKDTRAVDINPEFLEAFTVLENWYLEPEFIHRYPQLVAGLPPSYINLS